MLATGGASGIGKAVCQALAAEGSSVIVTDQNKRGAQESAESLPQSEGTKHMHCHLDVSSGHNIRKVLEEVLAEYQTSPCILVNSAGITSDEFLLKMDEQKFDKVIEVNLKVKYALDKAHFPQTVVCSLKE